MLEQPIGKIGHTGTSTAETATVSSSVNTPYTPSVTECTVNITPVNNFNTHPTHVNNPSSLYDILSPLLLHQHSTLTSLQHILNPLLHLQTIPISSLQQLHHLLASHPHANIHLPPLPKGSRPRRPPPVSYTDPNEPTPMPAPPLLSFPLGSQEGVGVAPSTLSTSDNDAGLGLFSIVPKRSSYARLSKFKHLFARKGDYICSYNGPLRSPQECISHPSMYLFSDPMDKQHRYIDSWTSDGGVTSYGGFVNESFNDDEINCTIKWLPTAPPPASTLNETSS